MPDGQPAAGGDLMTKDTKNWIPVNTYQDKTNIVKGEVGKWFNTRVIETTVPFREATNGAEGTFSSSGGSFGRSFGSSARTPGATS